MEVIHCSHIIHCDIKPANFLMGTSLMGGGQCHYHAVTAVLASAIAWQKRITIITYLAALQTNQYILLL